MNTDETAHQIRAISVICGQKTTTNNMPKPSHSRMPAPMRSARLDILPPTVTAQQKGLSIDRRTGRACFYTKSSVKSVAKLYAVLLAHQRPPQPIAGPVHLCIRYQFPFRSKERAAARAAGYRLHDVRPDLDNLEKLLIDTLTTSGYWHDDSQISIKLTAKIWGKNPGIDILYGTANAPWLTQHFQASNYG